MVEALMEREGSRVLATALEALGPVAMRTPGIGSLVDSDGFERLLGAVDDEEVRLLVEGLGVLSGEEFDSLRVQAAQAGGALIAFPSSPDGWKTILTWMRERRAAQVMKSCGAALVEQ